jgi:hypothetical protein
VHRGPRLGPGVCREIEIPGAQSIDYSFAYPGRLYLRRLNSLVGDFTRAWKIPSFP